MTLLVEENPADCRSRLVQAAIEVFAEQGYRASIDTVASRAEVARQTLYNHFPCKADLFAEVVRQATAALLITLEGEPCTLRERLLRFGLAYRSKLMSAEGLGFYRTVVAEATRFPDLAASFYRTGPLQTAERLSGVLRNAMDRNEFRRDDPLFAAGMLLSMLVGNERSRYLCSGEPPPEPEPDLVAKIIDCYLRSFAPQPHPSHSTPAPQRSMS